jgi:hypothetical protein
VARTIFFNMTSLLVSKGRAWIARRLCAQRSG